MTVPQALDLAIAHHQAGRLSEAEALYRQILAAQPGHAQSWHLLGVIACQAQRYEQAVELIRKALVLNPSLAAAHSNLGEALRSLGRLEEAVASLRRALELQPDFADALTNLGNALRDVGRLEEAITAGRRAIELRPTGAEAHNNVGNALRDLGRLDEAIAAYQRALQLKPNEAQFHNNLGIALREQGRIAEAIAAARRALQLCPEFPEACNDLGHALQAQDQFDEAIALFRRALECQPGYAAGWNNLGYVHMELGDAKEALAHFRRALELNPDLPIAQSNLLLALHLAPDVDRREIGTAHEQWNRRVVASVPRNFPPHANSRNPDRRLHIGYVSPDFRDHVVGNNLVPLFKFHDRQNYKITCYSGVVRARPLTEFFRQHSDTWRDTAGLRDEALAGLIRDDAVDVLVDLSQHTAGNRLPVFALRPAPVQLSFAGYPESTGLEAIEYRISDKYLECGISHSEFRRGGGVRDKGLPENGRALPNSAFSKERVYCIDSFWCYDPNGIDLQPNALPAQENGRVTLGGLVHFRKTNACVMRLWARVLAEVKDSRLLLLTGPGAHRQRALETFARAGIDTSRVEFADRCSRHDYLRLYQRVDIALDAFPYNGHTTSLDALWMGVPVVSLAGEYPVSRAGWSQLSNLGLPELVARTEDEYVKIAVEQSRNLSRLADLRRTLRGRMENSLLMNAPHFARQIEQAYRAMWREWCAR